MKENFFEITFKNFSVIKNLITGKVYNISGNNSDRLRVYCYEGVSKHLFNVWQTAYVSTNNNYFFIICVTYISILSLV